MRRPRIEVRKTSIGEARNHGLDDMMVRHAEETIFEYGVPQAVDWPQYLKLERAGAYLMLGAFAGGRLVGYSGFNVHRTIQARHFLQAMNDVLYLEREHRRGLAGARLIREAEPILRELGVKRITYYAPMVNLIRSSTDAKLARLLNLLGYPAYETSHAKLL